MTVTAATQTAAAQIDNWVHEYEALCNGVAVQARPDHGALLLRDADRVDFLQRMTTNNIAALRPGHSTVTVLTTATARIRFVFTVLCRDEDLLLLPAAGETGALAAHLRSQIFFMDKVSVEDVSARYRRLRIMGPHGGAHLAPNAIDLIDSVDGSWRNFNGAIMVKQMSYDLPGYEALASGDECDRLMTRLTDAGAVAISHGEAYHARRVELGRPLPGHEATADFSPLETGLAWTCAENKGCYTGQEIIARQITYDKVTKRLVGLRSAQPLAVGATVTGEGDKKLGVVTSVAHSPALATPVALAVVNRTHADPGAQVRVGAIDAAVDGLPFTGIDPS